MPSHSFAASPISRIAIASAFASVPRDEPGRPGRWQSQRQKLVSACWSFSHPCWLVPKSIRADPTGEEPALYVAITARLHVSSSSPTRNLLRLMSNEMTRLLFRKKKKKIPFIAFQSPSLHVHASSHPPSSCRDTEKRQEPMATKPVARSASFRTRCHDQTGFNRTSPGHRRVRLLRRRRSRPVALGRRSAGGVVVGAGLALDWSGSGLGVGDCARPGAIDEFSFPSTNRTTKRSTKDESTDPYPRRPTNILSASCASLALIPHHVLENASTRCTTINLTRWSTMVHQQYAPGESDQQEQRSKTQ